MTRKRCVFFHRCDGCCYEGTEINDLSDPQREKLSDISRNLVEADRSLLQYLLILHQLVLTVDSVVRSGLVILTSNVNSGFIHRKP